MRVIRFEVEVPNNKCTECPMLVYNLEVVPVRSFFHWTCIFRPGKGVDPYEARPVKACREATIKEQP